MVGARPSVAAGAVGEIPHAETAWLLRFRIPASVSSADGLIAVSNHEYRDQDFIPSIFPFRETRRTAASSSLGDPA